MPPFLGFTAPLFSSIGEKRHSLLSFSLLLRDPFIPFSLPGSHLPPALSEGDSGTTCSRHRAFSIDLFGAISYYTQKEREVNMGLFVCFVPTKFGFGLLGWRKSIELFILPQKTQEDVFAHLYRWGVKKRDVQEAYPPFPGITENIQAYFEGECPVFSYPLALERFSPFTHKVFEAVAQIPYGTTLTYGDIARKIALPHATRAVGRAIGRNPFPLFVPCHRVIGKLNLGGFSGYGLRYKIFLLSLELSRNGLHRNGSL